MVRGAKHSRERAESEGRPESTVGANTRALDSGDVVSIARSPKRSTKPFAHKYPGRRRDLFWVIILYFLIVIGMMVASGIYLTS